METPTQLELGRPQNGRASQIEAEVSFTHCGVVVVLLLLFSVFINN